MSLTKVSLAGNNGDGKIANLSYSEERLYMKTEEQEDRNLEEKGKEGRNRETRR
jgi:hypothetical protein